MTGRWIRATWLLTAGKMLFVALFAAAMAPGPARSAHHRHDSRPSQTSSPAPSRTDSRHGQDAVNEKGWAPKTRVSVEGSELARSLSALPLISGRTCRTPSRIWLQLALASG